jgi:hypothetical protein
MAYSTALSTKARHLVILRQNHSKTVTGITRKPPFDALADK